MTELQSSGRTGRPLLSETLINDGQWHRVGLTWDNSNRALYVDDVIVATDTQTHLAGTSKGLTIGTNSDLDTGCFWFGMVDEVRIYDRAVTP